MFKTQHKKTSFEYHSDVFSTNVMGISGPMGTMNVKWLCLKEYLIFKTNLKVTNLSKIYQQQKRGTESMKHATW